MRVRKDGRLANCLLVLVLSLLFGPLVHGAADHAPVEARPNLVVVSVTYQPDPPVPGANEVLVTVQNIGQATAGPARVVAQRYHEGVDIHHGFWVGKTATLSPGKTQTFANTWFFGADVHQYRFVVDGRDEVRESSEDDNALWSNITIGTPTSQLGLWNPIRFRSVEPGAAGHATQFPFAGENVRAEVLLGNRHVTAPSGPVRVQVRIDGALVADGLEDFGGDPPTLGYQRPALSPAFVFPAGEHVVDVEIDPYDEIGDAERFPVVKSLTTTGLAPGTPVPDVVITDVRVGGTLHPGVDAAILATVANQGDATSDPFALSLTIEPMAVSKSREIILEPGESLEVVLVALIPSSGWWEPYLRDGVLQWEVRAVLDDGAFETNLDNLKQTGTVPLWLADVTPVGAAPRDQVLRSGEYGAIAVSVGNKGPGTTVEPVLVQVAIDHYAESALHAPRLLAPGGTADLLVPWLVEPGMHTVDVQLDPAAQYVDADRANNRASFTFEVGTDVGIVDVGFPDHLWWLDVVSLNVTVANVQMLIAEGVDVVVDANGRTCATSRIDEVSRGVPVNEVVTFRPAACGLLPGEHDVTVRLDPRERLPEFERDNNVYETTVVFAPLPP